MEDEHRDIREQLLPYALGQLDAAQRAEVEAALDGDAELRRELEQIEAVGAHIVGSVPRVPAPPDLKARVLHAVSAGADRPAVASRGDDVAGGSRANAAAASPVSLDDARGRRRRRAVPAALSGMLAAACLVLAAVAFSLSQDVEDQRARAERLERDASGRRGSPVGLEGTKVHAVSTKGAMDQAHGSLLKISDKQWILVLRDVPSAGVGRSWQVWTLDSNGFVENVAQWVNGTPTRVLVLDRSDVREVMVSLEPGTRPAPVPSSAPVANVKV